MMEKYYAFNVHEDEGSELCWDNFVKYGFLTNFRFRKKGKPSILNNVGCKLGSNIFAYIGGTGYMGFGTINKIAGYASDFVDEVNDPSFTSFYKKYMDYRQQKMEMDLSYKRKLHEFELLNFIGVEWQKDIGEFEPRKLDRRGDYPTSPICMILKPEAVDILKVHFGIK